MRQVAHVLLTRPPLASLPKEIHSLDLHVLGTPPAFVLSQDQTLNKKFNLLLKLLWVFIRLKRIAGFILTIFCSIFKDHLLCHTEATSLSYHWETFLSTLFLKQFFIIYINEKFILCFDLLVMSLKTILIITSNIN